MRVSEARTQKASSFLTSGSCFFSLFSFRNASSVIRFVFHESSSTRECEDKILEEDIRDKVRALAILHLEQLYT
jgi:hypothetical protein